MRIALIVTGGVDASARDKVIPSLLSLIARVSQRHEIHVFALRYLTTPTSYRLLGATVHDLGSPHGIRNQYHALRTALARLPRVDVLHGYWALPAGLVTTLAGWRAKVPSVVMFDSGELVSVPDIGYGSQRTWRQRLAVRTTAALASRIVVCTHYQQRLAERLGIESVVIPLGAEPDHFPPSPPPPDGPPWRLLHVGSINPVKDHDTLLRAMRRLLDRQVDVALDVVGEDTMNGAIQRLASALALDGRVTFHGAVPHDQLARFYQRSHLFVLPSRHEAAGMVVLEAAVCGLPVVGSAVGYIADWMPDRATGVPPHNPEALADAIQRLLASPVDRRVIADAAKAWATANDAGTSADRLEQLWTELAGR